ncbi:hypothetical protein PGTUg99_035140 [Puccinia graminis f. sp. tritici]|uniref:Uncharacterized protein n=1 Tax=Puccinia graminis f. sp. tritici TaxID=56615 RepID=A0A5B0MI06_PUCGR|nr:hypothetical protein PGTUg99_035140 [Puccinia graminis f. sp. tritici]
MNSKSVTFLDFRSSDDMLPKNEWSIIDEKNEQPSEKPILTILTENQEEEIAVKEEEEEDPIVDDPDNSLGSNSDSKADDARVSESLIRNEPAG